MSMRSRRSVGPVMANMTTGGAGIGGGVPTATSAAPLIPAVIVAPATTTFVPSVPTQATVHEHEAFIPSPSVPLHLRTSTTPPPPTTTVVVNTNGTNANGNSNMNNPNVHVVVDDRGPTTTAIVSDLSTLECESVQADPHWTPPTTPEMPFVPPLEISIPVWKRTTPPPPAPSTKPPVNPAHSSSSYRGSNINNTIRKPKLMTRQASCHSRFFQQHQQYTASAANYVTDSELVEEEEDPVMILPQNAVEGDDEDAVASYYTSPTDMLYLSDESEMILPETSPNNHNNPTTTSRRSKTKTMRREFQKLFRRNRHKVVRPKPQHQQPSHDDDYESFASSRGCLI
eukprot:scaffold5234_cov131-Cylindrotheca_fusiformis.AAC.3